MKSDIKEITEELNNKLENFQTDEKKLLEYLEFQSRFYQGRSFRNNLLIYMYKPSAKHVATYKQWKDKYNRIVVACIECREFANAKCTCEEITKPVRIAQLRPIIVENKEDEEDKKIFYRDYTVYDISDTEPLNDEGLEVHHPNEPILLSGNSGQEILMLASIFIEKEGWEYNFRAIPNGANGFTNKETKEIRISNNMDTLQQAKTTIHELAHYHLHLEDDFNYLQCRDLAEVQAESVAYTVLKFLGLNSSDYSVKYIIGWANNDLELFKSSLKDIVETSQKIINDLELTQGEI